MVQTIDWPGAIEQNREALLRIVAALFAMAGWDTAAPEEGGATLPRHLRNGLLRILRPAESAARRLIVIVARDLSAETGPPRARGPKKRRPKASATGIVYPPGYRHQGEERRETGRTLSLPLLDPLKRFDFHPRRRYAKTFPRISIIGVTEPRPIPENRIPMPGDAVDAIRLRGRLVALKQALDDLPGQAKRLARWQARRALRKGPGRLSPMRPGWPPGYRKRHRHEVDGVLGECHSLAVRAQSPSDLPPVNHSN